MGDRSAQSGAFRRQSGRQLLVISLVVLPCIIALLICRAEADPSLTVTIAGSGSGTVTSNPVGISCVTGSASGCTAMFATPLTLFATPDWKSLFGGWSAPCSGTGNCDLTLAGDTGVTATFSPNYQATILGHDVTQYATLQDAYAAAFEGSMIAASVHTFYEDLVLNRAIDVSFEFGKGDMYLRTVGYTTLQGSLTCEQGSVVVRELIIQ